MQTLSRIGRTAGRAARATHYLAGGTLRLADLRDGIRTEWEDHYRRSSPEELRGLLPWEEEVANRFVPAGAHVLIVGSGSGRDVLAFVERGCAVTGVEPSSAAVASARQRLQARALTAHVVEGFFEEAAVAGSFDIVIFSYYCYTRMPGSRRRTAALARAASFLRPGGYVLVSYSHKSAAHPALILLARVAGALCRSDWRVEPGDLLWENRGPRPTYSYAHAFQPGEVEREAAAANLAPVFACDSDDGRAIVFARNRT